MEALHNPGGRLGQVLDRLQIGQPHDPPDPRHHQSANHMPARLPAPQRQRIRAGGRLLRRARAPRTLAPAAARPHALRRDVRQRHEDADQLADLEIAPVTVVVPAKQMTNTTTRPRTFSHRIAAERRSSCPDDITAEHSAGRPQSAGGYTRNSTSPTGPADDPYDASVDLRRRAMSRRRPRKPAVSRTRRRLRALSFGLWKCGRYRSHPASRIGRRRRR